MHDYWIMKAIRICGSQKELAHRMGIHQEKISYLLNRAKRMKVEDAELVEMATKGQITRYHLVNSLSPTIRKVMVQQAKDKILRKSERIALVMGEDMIFEEEESAAERWENFPKKKRRRDEMATQKAGFKNYKTYQQAKKVVCSGIPALIAAMDKEALSVHLAFRIARLPEEKQAQILKNCSSKKEMILALKCYLPVPQQPLPLVKDQIKKFLWEQVMVCMGFLVLLEN